jgi:hypothetical protein
VLLLVLLLVLLQAAASDYLKTHSQVALLVCASIKGQCSSASATTAILCDADANASYYILYSSAAAASFLPSILQLC